MSSTITFRAQNTVTSHWHAIYYDHDDSAFTLTVEGRTHQVALNCALWQGASIQSFSSFLSTARESNKLSFQLRGRQLHFHSSPPLEADDTYSLEANAPEWRTIRQGLSVMGKCSEATCPTRGEAVCAPLGLGFFNQEDAEQSAFCPQCSKTLSAVTSWVLWDCIFTIPDGERKAPAEKALTFGREVVAKWRWIETRTKARGCTIL